MKKIDMRFKISFLVFLGILACLGMYACKGGSSSSGVSSEGMDGYGKIGLYLSNSVIDATDLSQAVADSVVKTDDVVISPYKHIKITLTSVTLLPSDENGEWIRIFTSEDGYTIDLMELQDEPWLLTLEDQIPAGRYAKIRVGVSAIETEGGPCDGTTIKVPSDRIDFDIKGGFVLGDGQAAYVQLDVDANKCFNLHVAGDSGKCVFNPFVRAIIKTEPTCFWRHPYKGTITEITSEGFTMLRENACQGYLDVKLSDETPVFTADGVFGLRDALEINQDVTVVGLMDEAGFLNAKAVIIGDALVIKGQVVSELEAVVDTTNYRFNMHIDDGAPDVPVVLYPQTIVRSGCDTEQTLSDIQVGTRLVVAGKFVYAPESFVGAAGVLILP